MAKLKDEFHSAEHYLLALTDGKSAATKSLRRCRSLRSLISKAAKAESRRVTPANGEVKRPGK